MQRLEVSGAVRLIYKSLGVKGLKLRTIEGHLPLCLPSYLFPSGFPTKKRMLFFSLLCISVTFRAYLQFEAPRIIL